MKTEAEVSARVRDLLVLVLSERIDAAEKRLPGNCKFNHRHPIDERRNVDGDPNPDYNQIKPAARRGRTIGLCMYGAENPTEWPGTICEDSADAAGCPWFTPRQTRDEIVAEFQQHIKDPLWLDENLPKVHTLRWVLDDNQEPTVPDPQPVETQAIVAVDEVPAIPESWFSRVWRAVWGK